MVVAGICLPLRVIWVSRHAIGLVLVSHLFLSIGYGSVVTERDESKERERGREIG